MKKEYEVETGDWGRLEHEPCRFCRQAGGVLFMIDDKPGEQAGHQAMRCDKCGKTWEADSSCA